MQKFFNVTENTKIYILAPAGVVTGGVELLHQLCDVLNRNGQSSYIVYFGTQIHEIPNDYKKYIINVEEISSIIDSENNIIVIPETAFRFLNDFTNIKVLIWWLSVDNYFAAHQAGLFETVKYFYTRNGLKAAFKSLARKTLKRKSFPTYTLKKLKNNKNILCHAYQSEYAADFLKKHGIFNISYLSDYINDDYIYDSSVCKNKENIIIYNPKKGYRFTKKLIRACTSLIWIPIQNMTRAEVKDLMLRAKLYVDFGHHPGKDRMPREAAMCGCCVITGKLGAAGFSEDLPIDENEYKFDQEKKDISQIIEKIHYILKNYENEIEKFSSYRARIASEKSQFEKQVLFLLGQKD